MYRSELTNEPIDDALKDQRPIAVMVDNEQTALPHYGTADADVVYELMNSTMNNRITRLMCLYKDWEKITQVGSVRSTRPTNILLAAEWNAVLCHDGGPYYNDQYFKKDYSAHFSGGFSRVNNGKSREFTEYIKSGDLDKKFKASKYSTTYNEYRPDDDSHFNFSADTDAKLSDTYKSVLSATDIELPFTHNGSELKYNEKTQTYDYYEYGKVHKDADTGKVLTFKNVILQDCTFNQLDEHGYLIYNCIDTGKAGFYLTNGQAKNISWIKANETDPTRYYDENGDEYIYYVKEVMAEGEYPYETVIDNTGTVYPGRADYVLDGGKIVNRRVEQVNPPYEKEWKVQALQGMRGGVLFGLERKAEGGEWEAVP